MSKLIALALALAAPLTIAAGCLSSPATCADGRRCPTDTTCNDDLGICVLPGQEDACDDLADGDSCSFPGSTGTCMMGVCVGAVCGDGIAVFPEECDGDETGGVTCTDLGFYTDGPVGCDANCRFDTSECAEICGDGVVNGSERCDGDDLGGMTNCIDLGFYDPGPVSCSTLCRHDTTGCTGECGDGIINGDEICDGKQTIGGCAEFGANAGTMVCSNACSPAYQQCAFFNFELRDAPSGAGINDIYVAPSGTVYTFGTDFQQFSGGAWTSEPSPDSLYYSQAWGLGDDLIFAAGRDGGTSSDNGWVASYDGTSWTTTMVPTPPLEGIWGVSATEVYAVAADGEIVEFDGSQWTAMTSPTGLDLHAVSGRSSTDVVAVGEDGVIVEFDGTEWETASSPASGHLNDVWVDASGVAFAVGEDGEIVVRWGSSWVLMDTPTDRRLVSVWGTSPANVYAVGWTGTVLHYNGRDWRVIETGSTALLFAVHGTSPADIFIGGGGGYLIHYQGIAYSDTSDPNLDHFRDVWTSSPENLWIATLDGLRQWDGSSWDTHFSGNQTTVVWGTGPDDVYAKNVFGLQHWTGSSWTQVFGGVWRDIHGAGQNDVYAVGNDRLATNRNGAWAETPVPEDSPSTSIGGVWAASADDVYAAGSSGTILHFDGATWSVVESPTTTTLSCISGTGPNDIFVGGWDGEILHFDGASWTVMATGTNLNITDIHARAPNDVFAMTGESLVLHFDGTAWSPVRTDYKDAIRAAWSLRNEVLLVGDDGYLGRLYRSATWGCTDVESHCGDAMDNDCDGAIDSRDSDCQGRLFMSEIHAGAPDYVEIVNRGAEPASIGGLSVASSADCPSGTDLDFEVGEPRSLGPDGVWRLVDTLAIEPRERYLGCGLIDNPDDSHWYALCAGPCDLESCYNVLDYVEKTDGITPPTGPACASFSPGPVDVSSEPVSTSDNSVQRSAYGGTGADGLQSDWTIAPLSRD